MSEHVALIQEALNYQEDHSLEGPLFPEALDALASLVEQLEAAQRKLSCGYDTGTGQNCGECLDCLKVNWHFAQEAVGHLREQLEALREAGLAVMDAWTREFADNGRPEDGDVPIWQTHPYSKLRDALAALDRSGTG